MKALTLYQPWASLIAIGAQKIETRSWGTLYRGPLAIHAAKNFPGWARELCFKEPFRSALARAGLTNPVKLPRGLIIATCTLVDCTKIHAGNVPPEPERSFGDYTPGRWAWFLEDIQALAEPVPAKGTPGLWEIDLGKAENTLELWRTGGFV